MPMGRLWVGRPAWVPNVISKGAAPVVAAAVPDPGPEPHSACHPGPAPATVAVAAGVRREDDLRGGDRCEPLGGENAVAGRIRQREERHGHHAAISGAEQGAQDGLARGCNQGPPIFAVVRCCITSCLAEVLLSGSDSCGSCEEDVGVVDKVLKGPSESL
jgi:hypothetical protein